MNNIVLANNGHDTVRPQGIYFRPLQIVYVTLNKKHNVHCLWYLVSHA